MPITTKTVLTRAQRRAILRIMLRDSGSTVWPDTALNVALDEALTFVQGRFPNVQRYVTTTTSSTAYSLPIEALLVQAVYVVPATNAGMLENELVAVNSRAYQGLQIASGSYSVATDPSACLLNFTDAVQAGQTLIVYYYAAQQPWGTPTDVNTGRDTVSIDLAPNMLQDGIADLLFYAGARRAALRYGSMVIESGGGRDFGTEYKAADDEFMMLMGSVGNLRPMRLTTGLY